jgi:hypothetical protein
MPGPAPWRALRRFDPRATEDTQSSRPRRGRRSLGGLGMSVGTVMSPIHPEYTAVKQNHPRSLGKRLQLFLDGTGPPWRGKLTRGAGTCKVTSRVRARRRVQPSGVTQLAVNTWNIPGLVDQRPPPWARPRVFPPGAAAPPPRWVRPPPKTRKPASPPPVAEAAPVFWKLFD